MFNNNKILVVIPAKGSSKNIPRKNIRLLNNKPLISYSIDVAKASQYIDDVVISTDDSETALIAEKFGASVVRRSPELSGDEISISQVVHDAMIQKEKQTLDEYDIVITIRSSAPLIKTETLDRAIEKFDDFSLDSVVSVVDDRGLNWGYDEKNQRYFPLYIERLRKAELPKSFKETRGFLVTRRSFVNEDSIIGTNIDVMEVSRQESVSIDEYEDWWIADNYLKKKKIAIVVSAFEKMGTGHIYRCLSIASKLVFHDVLFLMDEHHEMGINILNKYSYPFKVFDGESELFEILQEYHPQIVINDISDTTSEYINKLINCGYFVVNFEDLGVGSDVAHVVFDDSYEHESGKSNIYIGHKYFILKDDFYYQPPKIISNVVNNVLINFRGSDYNNLTEKVLDAILSTNYEGRINIILGSGYPDSEGLISKIESNPLVQVYTHISNVSEFMFKADVIFTAADKTMYEACSMGIPTICLCQNDREKSHAFANRNNGFINMGLGADVEKQDIVNQFVEVVNNYDLRLEMNRKMLSIDLKNGFENIWPIIQEEYRKFELNRVFNR